MLTKEQLHPYQKELISKAKTIPNLGLFLPPGLGKTITTLTIIAEQMTGKTLIIAPKRVAETVWDAEVKKWEHLSHLTVSKIMGSPAQRLKSLSEKADIYLINLENVAWLCGLSDKLVFTNLVIDESSRFKDPSTKRFKALKKHLKGFQRRLILTGTPTPQGMADLWSQVGILDLGQRLETSLTRFRDKYMAPDQMNRHTRVVYSWKFKPGCDQIVQDKISDICYSLKAKDYLQLPECTKIYHSIPFDKNVKAQYDELRKDMVVDIKKEKITAPTAAALANKLLQFTSGAVYNEEGEAQEVHRSKLEYLESIMEESSSPTLVFYHFKHSLQRLRHDFPVRRGAWTMTTLKRGVVARFVCFSHTHNLGASGLISSATLETQHKPCGMTYHGAPRTTSKPTLGFIAKGKTRPVIIHHLTVCNSIDEHVVKVLDGKINLQDALLNALNCVLV